MGAAQIRERFVVPNQQRFGTADRGNIGEHANMARDSKPPWVGNPLAITDQQIRLDGELSERRHHCWPLAEREESWNIGQWRWAACNCVGKWFEGRECQDDHDRAGDLTLIASINPCYCPQFPKRIVHNNALAQFVLDAFGIYQ
jgi:hypothetical protein